MGPAWLWLLGAGVLASARGDTSPGPPQAPSGLRSEPAPAYHRVTPTITSFALRVYRQLAAGAPGNVVFSPVSVSAALALLSRGVPADTSARILEGLGFNLTETPQVSIHQGFQSLLHTLGQPSPKLELKLGNSLFLDKRLEPQQCFLDDVRELYGALALSANFTDSAATRRHVSDYVRKQTYGQVADSLPELREDTLVVLLNYIFFKGACAPGRAAVPSPVLSPAPGRPCLQASRLFPGAVTPLQLNSVLIHGLVIDQYLVSILALTSVLIVQFQKNTSFFIIISNRQKYTKNNIKLPYTNSISL